jgi:hypothetical protein
MGHNEITRTFTDSKLEVGRNYTAVDGRQKLSRGGRLHGMQKSVTPLFVACFRVTRGKIGVSNIPNPKEKNQN